MNPCKSLLLRLFVIHGALTLFLFEVADAARFTSPSQNSDRFVFLGDDVTFEWVYQLDNPSTSYSIQCGYRETTPRWVLTKDGNNAAAVTTTFRNRVDKLSEQNNRIGFKLKQCQFNDAGNLGCQLIVNGLPEYSYMFQLKIYERPRYIDCLGPAGTVFILNEGQPINSTCTYYGNPQPTLRCQALDANGQSVRATSPDTFTVNLTGSNRLILNDIQRTVKTVKCTATNGQTGNVGVQTARAEQIRQVTVYYPPTAPVNLILMKSTHSTISVRWEQPKETGNRPIITYYVETVNPTGFRSGTNVTIFNNPSKIDYTIRYLQSKVKYTVNVYAYNSVGRGNLASGTFETIIYTTPDAARFTSPAQNSEKIVFLGNDVNFEWVYQLDNPSTSYSIQCGYRESTPRWVLTKDGNNPAVVTNNFRYKVEKLSEQNNIIGFKLKQCQQTDAGKLGCQLFYGGLPIYSNIFTLKIFETRSESSSKTGLIVGLVVVGGIALLIIILLLAVYFYKKKT